MHDTLIISIILVMTMIIICSMSVRISRAEKKLDELQSKYDKIKNDFGKLKPEEKNNENNPRKKLLDLFDRTEGY